MSRPQSSRKRYAGKNLTIIREDRPKFVSEQRQDIQETACQLLADGKSLQQAADYIGVTRTTLMYLRRKYPALREELERATFEGTVAILEEIRDTPFRENNPHRARVKIEAMCKYLELRWPERFGKRLDVTVKTIDMQDALSQARARAGLTIEGVVESTAYGAVNTVLDTDSVSVADPSGVDEFL